MPTRYQTINVGSCKIVPVFSFAAPTFGNYNIVYLVTETDPRREVVYAQAPFVYFFYNNVAFFALGVSAKWRTFAVHPYYINNWQRYSD